VLNNQTGNEVYFKQLVAASDMSIVYLWSSNCCSCEKLVLLCM